MTKEQKDKIFKVLAEDRNGYARDCNRRIAEENGKIKGAHYMLQRLLDILNTEREPQDIITCNDCKHYKRIELNSCDEVITSCKKHPDRNYHYLSPDFYCADGERSEG